VGVGAGSPARLHATAWGWALGTVLAGLAAPIQPPTMVMAALFGALLSLLAGRAFGPRARGAVLAVAAAPLWVAAGGPGSQLGPAPEAPGVLGAAVLALALVLAVAGRGGLPRGLRRVLLVGGLVLALRAFIVAPELAQEPGLGGLLVLGCLLVAGVAAAPGAVGEGKAAALALSVSAGLVLARSVPAWSQVPQSAGQVRIAARLGRLDRVLPALVARPALGLAAVAAVPEDLVVGQALLPTLHAQVLVDAGWQPGGAGLPPDQVVALALALDRRGRGGEAARLAWRARTNPQVAWTYALLARDQGAAQAAELVLATARPPAGTPTLPGQLALDWAFLHPGSRTLDLQVDQALAGLRLATRGEAFEGPPVLWVSVDADAPVALSLPEGPAWVPLARPLAPGPHRIRVRYHEDRDTPGGDRNAWVEAIAAP